MKFYCELKKKEIELTKIGKAPMPNKFIYGCSENHKIIGGVNVEVGCSFHFDPKCEQAKHRMM